jgi:c-di-AMP phosphodiesterase-like protein
MSFINDSLIILINIIHIIVIIFVLVTPFTDSNYLMLLHIIIIPFILMHWVLNNNTCCLTVTEKFIREVNTGTKVKDNDCFTYKLVAPIYDFNKDHEALSTFTYILTISLWFISVFNISNKICTNQIKSINDLCMI